MVKEMTKEVLLSAFSGESMAHMRYLIFADVAEKEGFKNVARLFRAIAYAEQVHATNHYRVLSVYNEDAKGCGGVPIGPGDTKKNLELAIRGEEFEVAEMYPTYMKIAEFQGENDALRSFTYAYKAEQIHARLYKEAKESVEAGKDLSINGKVWICPICGYTHVGENPPDRCPVCGAKGETFKSF
jgi:rubrerythrin